MAYYIKYTQNSTREINHADSWHLFTVGFIYTALYRILFERWFYARGAVDSGLTLSQRILFNYYY